MQSSFYEFIVLRILPYIRFSVYYTDFPGWVYQRGYKLLQPGDIILSGDRKKLTSMLIPGSLPHGSFCVAKNTEYEVAEMTHTNWTKSTFFDICKEATRVIIIRCVDFDDKYIDAMIFYSKSLEDSKYDTQFELGIKALYCFELPYQLDYERRMKLDLSDLVELGRPYLSSVGYMNMPNKIIVWDSNWEKFIN